MRRGFTLIELGISIAILLIVFSFSIVGIKSFENYIIKTKCDESIFEVEDFLNIAKERAVNRDKGQKICIENKKGSYILELIEEGELVDKLYLENIWDNVSCNRELEITKEGAVQACTISMIRKNEKYAITIQIGGDFISSHKF